MSRVTGPKLCLLVPIWIDLMTAWDFWMKLAKPDPMSDEMKKMRKCFKDAYYLFMVEQIWVWALGCWRVILFPLESRPCLPNLRVLRGHLARSEAMIYLPGVGDQLPFKCSWAPAYWLMQLQCHHPWREGVWHQCFCNLSPGWFGRQGPRGQASTPKSGF